MGSAAVEAVELPAYSKYFHATAPSDWLLDNKYLLNSNATSHSDF